MSEYKIPYGKGYLNLHLPSWVNPVVITPKVFDGAPDPLAAIQYALHNLVGEVDLDIFSNVHSVAIAINDSTRPVPNHLLLPPLLRYLESFGIHEDAIQFYIATGTHPLLPIDEYSSVVPDDILRDYQVVCHKCDDPEGLSYLGCTSRGTPVWINMGYAEADLRIVVGMIEPHQFQGFSGGVKGAAIGLAGRDTINNNHAMMNEAGAQLGRYNDNPARQDVEEIGKIIGVHFALNVILNGNREIVRVIAGDPWQVMEKGIPLSREICQVSIKQDFDMVIASPGGHPKDINLYQAQKALAHAGLITREGGTIVLVAACPEGTGSRAYEAFMDGVNTHREVFDRFRDQGFQVGEHKALQIARDACRVQILLVSDMPPELVRRLLLTPVTDLDSATTMALHEFPEDGRVAILPRASSTIPYWSDS